jgi:hypothetical protein
VDRRVGLAVDSRVVCRVDSGVGPRVVGSSDGPVGVVDGRQRRRGVDLGMLGRRVVGGRGAGVEALALGPAGVVVVILLVLVGGHRCLSRHLGGADDRLSILGHQVVRVVRSGLASRAGVVGLSVLQS